MSVAPMVQTVPSEAGGGLFKDNRVGATDRHVNDDALGAIPSRSTAMMKSTLAVALAL